MGALEYTTDRQIISTDNNEFSDGDRDENLWDEDLTDTDIPTDDDIPDGVNESRERPRPEYDEEGFRHKPEQ